MEYSKRDKIKKILKYVAIIAGVLLVLILGLLFLQAHRNAGAKGQPYSIKKFIIDFGASIRGKQISDPSVFDGGLFPLFGLNGDGNLPIDGSGTNGGTTINTDGSGNGTGTDGTNGNGTGTDGSGTDGTQTPQCSDRVDNDADGAVDMDDPDCTDPSDYFESTYNWDTGGDGFYNYDNGTYGPIDYGDFGFDPNYNFDFGNDQETVAQCVPKDYIFKNGEPSNVPVNPNINTCADGIDNNNDGKTDLADTANCPNEQFAMDLYNREFLRIAPNLRTGADVQSEKDAKESYQSLINTVSHLLNGPGQCIDQRKAQQNSSASLYPDITSSLLYPDGNYLYLGARGMLRNLQNYNYLATSDPDILVRQEQVKTIHFEDPTGAPSYVYGFKFSTSFFPPDKASLPWLDGDDFSAILSDMRIKVNMLPGNDNGDRFRNATCMVREGATCGGVPVFQGPVSGSSVGLGVYLFSATQLDAAGGIKSGTLYYNVGDNVLGIPSGTYQNIADATSDGNNNFWELTDYEDPEIPGGSNSRSEMNLGACYVEMYNKYPAYFASSAYDEGDSPFPVTVDKKTFWNLVADCDKVYDSINDIRQNFESTFGIN